MHLRDKATTAQICLCWFIYSKSVNTNDAHYAVFSKWSISVEKRAFLCVDHTYGHRNERELEPNMATHISAVTSKVHPVNPDETQDAHMDTNESDVGDPKLTKMTLNLNVPYTQTLMYKAMIPMFWSLRICGLGFVLDEQNTTSAWAAKKQSSQSFRADRVYSSIVQLILWLNVGRMTSSFLGGGEFGPELFWKIIAFTWMLLCALNALVMYRISHTKNLMGGFFLELQHLLSKCHPDRCLRFVHVRIIIATTLSWIIIVINVIFYGYLLFFTTMVDNTLAPATPDIKHITVVRVLCMLLMLYLSAAWVLPTAFFFSLCLVVYRTICGFNTNFRNDNCRLRQIERYRTWHNHLSQLVDLADDMFSPQVASTLITSVVNITLILYNIIWYPGMNSDPLVLLSNSFWLSSGIVILIILAVGGGMINHVVSSTV